MRSGLRSRFSTEQLLAVYLANHTNIEDLLSMDMPHMVCIPAAHAIMTYTQFDGERPGLGQFLAA